MASDDYYDDSVKDFQLLEPIRFGQSLNYWQNDICINNIDSVVIDVQGSAYFHPNDEEMPDTISWLDGAVVFYHGDDPVGMVCIDSGSPDDPVFEWLKKTYNFDITQTAFEQLQ